MELARSEPVDGAVVLSAAGRLNLTTAPQLRRTVDEAVTEGRARVVLDLTDVVFIDSSGLGAIVGGLKAARQAGGDLRIAGAGEQVRTVLGLTNLDRVLRPHVSVADALEGW
ncbi:MAG TPA: STAS domain-containing protein [Nocardioides sp.]|nr:STAS domain-containing protein [Nocardioides sp.]